MAIVIRGDLKMKALGSLTRSSYHTLVIPVSTDSRHESGGGKFTQLEVISTPRRKSLRI